MNNENTNANAETDTGKSSAKTLLAYVEAAVIADMFKPVVQTKDTERSAK